MHVWCKSRKLFSFCTRLVVQARLRALQKLCILRRGPATRKPPVLVLCWHRGCGCVSAPGGSEHPWPQLRPGGGWGNCGGECSKLSALQPLTQHRGWKPSRSFTSKAITLTTRSAQSFPAFSSQTLPSIGSKTGLTGIQIPWTRLCCLSHSHINKDHTQLQNLQGCIWN